MAKKTGSRVATIADNGHPSSVEDVVTWYCQGLDLREIRAKLKQTHPRSDGAKAIAKAVDHFAAAARCDVSVVVGWALESMRLIYGRQIELGDYAEAAKTVRQIVMIATTHCVSDEDETI